MRRWYARQKIPQSGVMLSDVKQGEGRGHRRSLWTDRRQGSKKFLIAVIKSRVDIERPESVLGPMFELAEIVPESFARC